MSRIMSRKMLVLLCVAVIGAVLFWFPIVPSVEDKCAMISRHFLAEGVRRKEEFLENYVCCSVFEKNFGFSNKFYAAYIVRNNMMEFYYFFKKEIDSESRSINERKKDIEDFIDKEINFPFRDLCEDEKWQ